MQQELSFDINEFPSLSGERRAVHGNISVDSMRHGAGGPPRTHPHYVDHATTRRSEFALQNENFPALPGATRGNSGVVDGKHDKKASKNVVDEVDRSSRTLGSVSGTRSDAVDEMKGGAGHPITSFGNAGVLGGRDASWLSKKERATTTSSRGDTKASQGSSATGTKSASANTRYGLLGLLDVIRMTDPDVNTLALGSDLTSLGLNLNSPECLHATFASPWSDRPTKCRPSFSLPKCYHMKSLGVNFSHIKKFQLETLFYIFYGMPRDALQGYAADELYQRNWRFHKDSKLWFSQNGPANSQQFVYFDFNLWERQLFKGDVKALQEGFLKPEEVKVSKKTQGS